MVKQIGPYVGAQESRLVDLEHLLLGLADGELI